MSGVWRVFRRCTLRQYGTGVLHRACLCLKFHSRSCATQSRAMGDKEKTKKEKRKEERKEMWVELLSVLKLLCEFLSVLFDFSLIRLICGQRVVLMNLLWSLGENCEMKFWSTVLRRQHHQQKNYGNSCATLARGKTVELMFMTKGYLFSLYPPPLLLSANLPLPLPHPHPPSPTPPPPVLPYPFTGGGGGGP